MKFALLIILIIGCVYANQNLVSPQIVANLNDVKAPEAQRFVQTQNQQVISGANYAHTGALPSGTHYDANWKPIALDGNSNQPGACPCGSSPQCPPCILAKSMKQMHDLASKNAEADAVTQNELAEQSELEKKLFDQANKYANEAAEEEKLAREAAAVLQEHASKAQIARNKMIRAESQAKQIAMKTLNTMTIHPPHYTVGVPGMKVQQVGTTVQTVTSTSPSYSLHISPTGADGFQDMIGTEINDAVSFNENKNAQQEQAEVTVETPGSVAEAQLNEEVYSSGQELNNSVQ